MAGKLCSPKALGMTAILLMGFLTLFCSNECQHTQNIAASYYHLVSSYITSKRVLIPLPISDFGENSKKKSSKSLRTRKTTPSTRVDGENPST
jgi:hypothetical protein